MNRPRPTGPVFYPYIVEPNPNRSYDVWFNAWRELPHVIATFDCQEKARQHAIGLNESYRAQRDIALALRQRMAELKETVAEQRPQRSISSRVREWFGF